MARETMMRRAAAKAAKALLPKTWKGKAVVFGIPALLVLALLDPVFGLVDKVFILFGRFLEPALNTTIGRVVATLLSLSILLAILWRLFRQQVREARCHALLGRHFDATAALLQGEDKRARDLLLAICRRKRVRPDAYPWIVLDACLKLARLALQAQRPAEALLWVARCSDPEMPPELDRSRAHLRLQALRAHGEALPQTALTEAIEACERHPKDARLWSELRALRMSLRDLEGAVDAQMRVVEHAEPAFVTAEQQTLCEDATACGKQALADDNLDLAKRMQRAMQKFSGPWAGLLQGEIHAHKGDFRAAIAALGRTASPQGLDRIASLLAEHPGCVEPRELLACCPMQGAVLLAARELARLGQHEEALRAARLAADSLGPTPTVCMALAETLEQIGQRERAQLLAIESVQALLQLAPSNAAPSHGRGQPEGPPKLA